MAPRSRGSALLFDSLVTPLPKQHICQSCRKSIAQRNRYASTATAQSTTIEAPPLTQLSPDEPAIAPDTQPRLTIKAGIVVSRPPLITPNPHPFDTAFYLYQRRLNERLVLPFTQYFHYKRGTPAFEHWRTKRRERGGVAARDIGKYHAYTKESWNDEVLMSDGTAQPSRIVEQLIGEEGRQAEFVREGEGGEEGKGVDMKMAGLKRRTEADKKGDLTSLERHLDRTLYLLVRHREQKGDERAWRFPSGDVVEKEGLKEAAQRVLGSSCGSNMNTWFVAGHPIGHLVESPASERQSATKEPTSSVQDGSDAIYFMKARIMAGQADMKGNSYDLHDFKWLSKKEIEEHVAPEYWLRVQNMLVEQ